MSNKTYYEYNGKSVNPVELEMKDIVALRVSWGSSDAYQHRPTIFEVIKPSSDSSKKIAEEGNSPIDSVKLKGKDDETYRIYTDNSTIECLTDGKDGYSRGSLTAKPKLLE